jgi:hypothetical protein
MLDLCNAIPYKNAPNVQEIRVGCVPSDGPVAIEVTDDPMTVGIVTQSE